MTKAERTRKFIIEKAAPIVNRKGIAGTSITDIMEATKLAKGGIYGNFQSKEEICSEALSYLLTSVGAAMAARVAGKTSAKEQLFGIFDYYRDSLSMEGNYGCPMLNFGVEADDTDPVIQQKVSKASTDMEKKLCRIVQGGIDRGEFDATLDAELFALKAFAMIQGGLWMSRVQRNNRKIRVILDMLEKEIEAHC